LNLRPDELPLELRNDDLASFPLPMEYLEREVGGVCGDLVASWLTLGVIKLAPYCF
jgi:hypothetical protein